MRHVLLLSMILLGAAFAVGQNYPSQTDSSQTATGDQTVIAGCLANANGNFQLTDHNGKNWTLTGDSAKLSEHVGHEVQIAGTSRSVSESPGAATGGTTGSVPGPKGSSALAIDVTSIKHIAEKCQSSSPQ